MLPFVILSIWLMLLRMLGRKSGHLGGVKAALYSLLGVAKDFLCVDFGQLY